VALSFAGYALLTELDAGLILHFVVGLGGIAILYGVARVFAWYASTSKNREPSKAKTSGLTGRSAS
jgi:hypothetical protein